MPNSALAQADIVDTEILLSVLAQVRAGDFTARMPLGWTGLAGKVADSLNEVILANEALGAELARVSQVVGKEGKLSQRLVLGGWTQSWAGSVASVNSLIDDLVRPTIEMQRVIGAVAGGDLSKKISIDVKGEFLELKNTVNAMVDQLNAFAGEVTRVAREVGVEGNPSRRSCGSRTRTWVVRPASWRSRTSRQAPRPRRPPGPSDRRRPGHSPAPPTGPAAHRPRERQRHPHGHRPPGPSDRPAEPRALEEDLGLLEARVTRYGHRYCMALLDVDHFKVYNDTYGHPAGDGVLRAVAAQLEGQMRGGDALYRYGGEEFLCVFPEQTLASGTVAIERMRAGVQGLALPHTGSGPGVVTVSAGMAILDAAGVHSADDVLKEADAALYRAKARGRNRVEQPLPLVAVVLPA